MKLPEGVDVEFRLKGVALDEDGAWVDFELCKRRPAKRERQRVVLSPCLTFRQRVNTADGDAHALQRYAAKGKDALCSNLASALETLQNQTSF